LRKGGKERTKEERKRRTKEKIKGNKRPRSGGVSSTAWCLSYPRFWV
jgi:hypothetical protein